MVKYFWKYRFLVSALQKFFSTKGSTYQPHQYLKPAVNRQPGFRRGSSYGMRLTNVTNKNLQTKISHFVTKKSFFCKKRKSKFSWFLSTTTFFYTETCRETHFRYTETSKRLFVDFQNFAIFFIFWLRSQIWKPKISIANKFFWAQ